MLPIGTGGRNAGQTLSSFDSRVSAPHLGTQRLRGGAKFTPRPAPPPIPEEIVVSRGDTTAPVDADSNSRVSFEIL